MVKGNASWGAEEGSKWEDPECWVPPEVVGLEEKETKGLPHMGSVMAERWEAGIYASEDED